MCKFTMKKCFKCMKDVEIEDYKYGLHADCFISWFKLSSTSIEFEDLVLKRNTNDSFAVINQINTSFFQGAFKKYSAKLNNHSYILKVQDDDYPELPVVEYLSNQIGQNLGLIIPNFYLIRFPNELDAKIAFVVHNFMEKYTPGNLIHINHFINNQNFSCKVIIDIIKEKVGRIGSLKQFIFLCLFDALIGNHDRHGRNIALIETKKGFELAPFYDNPSYLGIEEQSLLLAKHNPRGRIETLHSKEPTMSDYGIEFIGMGYQDWVKEFLKRTEQIKINQLIEISFLSEKRKQAFVSLIQQRLEELKNVLS